MYVSNYFAPKSDIYIFIFYITIGLRLITISPVDIIIIIFILVITDPDDFLTVSNTCFQKNEFYEFSKPWLGQGLVTADGKYCCS